MKSERVKTVTLLPEESKKVFVGIYERGGCDPQLEIEYSYGSTDEVRGELIEVALERGDYRLFYYFQNFSSRTCEVTIWEKCV